MSRILYVEDEPFLAKIVKESLESRGFEILHISDGGRAMEAFQEQQPELCVLDIMLPEKDGYEIAAEIREIDHEVPIIFLTAKDQTHDVINGFNQGGNDYIKKPFSMEELILRIQNLLNLTQKKVKEQKEIKRGSFVFQPLPMLLTYGDDQIHLSHRESEILKLLCEHQNQRLERKKILMKVWGDDSFFNSRNLDVYIRKLRKYFSPDDSVQIVTLKGVGYHFLVE